jgi:hypothetical protein
MAALAGVGQVVVLIVTAFFVWRYLDETQQLRTTAQQQLRANWRQVAVANDQLEAQIAPAVAAQAVPSGGSHKVMLTNVGKGPAFSIRFSATRRGSAGDGSLSSLVEYRVGLLTVGVDTPVPIQTGVVSSGTVPLPRGGSLQCEYRSLSGRTYYTVVDFNEDGTNVTDIRIYREPDMEQ